MNEKRIIIFATVIYLVIGMAIAFSVRLSYAGEFEFKTPVRVKAEPTQKLDMSALKEYIAKMRENGMIIRITNVEGTTRLKDLETVYVIPEYKEINGEIIPNG